MTTRRRRRTNKVPNQVTQGEREVWTSEAGSHRYREAGSRPIFMRTGHTVSAITRARSHRRLQAGGLETGKRKEKGETGSHPSTRT